MTETALLLQAYSADPIARFVMEDFDISKEQHNSVCGDSLCVYIKFDWDIIKDRSREWPAEMQTTAAASMLWEIIQWKNITVVLWRTYEFIKQLWLDLSPRRRRSWVTALLATRNALHQRLDDWILDTYQDMM